MEQKREYARKWREENKERANDYERKQARKKRQRQAEKEFGQLAEQLLGTKDDGQSNNEG